VTQPTPLTHPPGINSLRLESIAGDGVIARYNHVVVFALPQTTAEADFVDDLLRVAEMAAARAELPGRLLARRVAGLLALSDDDRVPAVCVVADSEIGTAVILHGSLEVEVIGSRSLQRVSGQGLLSWVDSVIKDEYDQLTILPSQLVGAQAQRWTDLRRGVSRGGGLILTRSAGPVDEVARSAEVTLSSPSVETPPSGATRAVLNELLARSSATETPYGPGALRSEDGRSFPLDASYLIGRSPELHPSVQAGALKAIVLDDREGLISRVHARVLVEGRRVRVVDEGSDNGTFLADPESDGWSPLPAGVPVEVYAGTRILVGESELIFDL
jgi:hypothetical protein